MIVKEYDELENKDAEKASEETHPHSKSLTLKNSIRGDIPPKQDDINWTHQDGTRYHAICQDTVRDQIEDVDNDIEVTNNKSIALKDQDGNPKEGIIDTLIEHKGHKTLIDYKTNDMSSWNIADAKKFGKEHGNQLELYQ
jgi:ATP-dependent exoDNAse (exonuclease V) beta subunit